MILNLNMDITDMANDDGKGSVYSAPLSSSDADQNSYIQDAPKVCYPMLQILDHFGMLDPNVKAVFLVGGGVGPSYLASDLREEPESDSDFINNMFIDLQTEEEISTTSNPITDTKFTPLEQKFYGAKNYTVKVKRRDTDIMVPASILPEKQRNQFYNIAFGTTAPNGGLLATGPVADNISEYMGE